MATGNLLRSYYDFRGGLNTDAAPDNLADNELVRADNVDLLERGGLKKRKGTVRLNAESYGGQVEQLFEWPRSNGEVWLMAVVEVAGAYKLYRVLEDQDYSLEEVATVAGPEVGFVPFPNPGPEGLDRLYFVDGEQYRVWDGTEVKTLADTIPDPPDEVPIIEAVDSPSGVESALEPGVYRCAITYASGFEGVELEDVLGDTPLVIGFGGVLAALRHFIPGAGDEKIPIGESDPSEVVRVEVKEGQEIKWSDIPSGPPEAKAVILYRSTADGTDLHVVAAIRNPVQLPLSYRDRTPDKDLVERRTMRWGNNLGAVAKCRYLVRHPNSYRFFAAGNPEDPAALYYSEPGEPDHFKPTSVMYPTEGDGPVVGITVFGDAVISGHKHGVWAWRGVDPGEDARWLRLPTGVGFASGKAVIRTPGSLTFYGQSGLYALSPAVLDFNVTIEPTEGIVRNLAANRVERLLREVRAPERAVAVFDSSNQRILLAYGEGEDAVRNNHVLVFDWTLGAFTRYTNLYANDLLYRLNGDTLIATNGFILKMGEGYDDHDGPIEMNVLTKAFNLDYPFHKKRLLRLLLGFRQPEQSTSLITLRIIVDDILRTEIQEAALYENMVWGEGDWGDIWGFRNTVTTRTRIYGSGHRVQMGFMNSQEGDPTTIYGCAFEFRPTRAKGRLL